MATFLIAAGATIAAKSQNANTPLRFAIRKGHRALALTLLRAGAPITVLRSKHIEPENSALHDYMVSIIDAGGWERVVERHRRPLMSILSRLALPQDALSVILSFWSPPGGH
jgi:ankyrin repeat protein